jgi:ketosteroid isomerase-like protein
VKPLQALPLFCVILYCGFAFGQKGPCTEQNVKEQGLKDEEPATWSDNMYFFSGAVRKPIIGKAALLQAQGKVEAQRKNERPNPETPDKIVVSESADMAFEYGTTHVEFDDKSSGKHQQSEVAYLRVWRAAGATCKIAATMMQAEDKGR